MSTKDQRISESTVAMHRLEEIGFTKSYIAAVFREWYDRPADDEWANRVRALLATRRVAEVERAAKEQA